MNHPANPVITITTVTGHTVSAPLLKWVQGLILQRSPEDLVELMKLVEATPEPLITVPRDTVPADPDEWLSGNGRRT